MEPEVQAPETSQGARGVLWNTFLYLLLIPTLVILGAKWLLGY